jgi:tetratricopeptide (TPR) repeat protein
MRSALRERRLQEAEQILAQLKLEDPVSTETRGFELELYLNANRLREADALARQLCRLFPQSSRIFHLAGKVAYRLKRYEEAETHFRESQRIYPFWRTQYWLGKTLTQAGKFEEAESLLLMSREHSDDVLLDLAWLHERRNDLDAALGAYRDYLAAHPENAYATEQHTRLKARLLDPESLIGEVAALKDMGEEVPPAVFPELVEKLFQTGQTPQARDEICGRMGSLDAKSAAQVAWICYRARAYDLATALFLAHLRPNLTNYKYLNALESAASRSNRLPQVLEAYDALLVEAPQLYGRKKSLARKIR